MINDEFSVDVNIRNGAKAAGGKAVLTYDADKLEVVSCKAGAAFTSNGISPTINYKTYGTGKIYFTFAASDDVTLDGALLNIVFKANTLGTANFGFSTVDFSDYDLNDVAFTASGGKTEISEFLLGDVNGDTYVDYKDSILILRYDTGTYALTTAQQKAADMTGDGNVDYKDAILVLRASAEAG